MMKSVKFGNKNALEIIDTDFKKTIKDLIWERTKIRLLDKNYRILNNDTLPYLKKVPHLVTLSTYGKKFLLCLLKINDKNHTIFIDRKGEMMIYMPLGFDETLYKGTIFDGELVKDNDGNWIFFIMDIVLYDGKPTYLKLLKDKIELVQNIITHKYTAKEMDFCRFEMKEYFPYQYIEDLSHGYLSRLNYKCSGLIFKNQVKNEKVFLYIFPENRSISETTPVSASTSTISSHIAKKIHPKSPSSPPPVAINNDDDDAEEDGDGDANAQVVAEETDNVEKEKVTMPVVGVDPANRVFLMKSTELPDVYELYGKNTKGQSIKVGMASITSMEVSKKINKIFEGGVKEVVIECRYIKRFKKWEPLHCVAKELSVVE